MSTTTPPGELLDQDAPDTTRLSVAEAAALGARTLHRLGFPDDDVRIIVDHLIDSGLCGYPFASLPRILVIAQDAKTRQPRQPVRVVHDTPVSALLDGGNNVGYVAVYRAAQLAIDKALTHRFAVVGMYNSYYSGRNAYYLGEYCLSNDVLIFFPIVSVVTRAIGGEAWPHVRNAHIRMWLRPAKSWANSAGYVGDVDINLRG